jgi:hypothetical protein
MDPDFPYVDRHLVPDYFIRCVDLRADTSGTRRSIEKHRAAASTHWCVTVARALSFAWCASPSSVALYWTW